MNMYQIKSDISNEIKAWKLTFRRLVRKAKRFLLELGFYSYRIGRAK